MIGNGASLRSAGLLSLLTGAGGALAAKVNQNTYGAGTIGISETTARIDPRNRVVVGADAILRADRDLRLAAGREPPAVG